jgi:type II secretion system protein N
MRVWLPWGAAALLLLGLFLWLTFPYEALQERIVAEVSNRSGWRLTPGRWRTNGLLGLEWHRLQVQKPNVWRTELPYLAVEIQPLSLFAGRPLVEARMGLSDQEQAEREVRVVVTMKRWSVTQPELLTGTVKRLDLGRLNIPSVKRGTLKMDVSHKWMAETGASDSAFGEGEWSAEASEMLLERLPVGGMTIPTLELTSVAARLRCRGAVCQFEQLRGDGPAGSASGEGSLRLGPSIEAVHLALAVTLTPGPGATALGLPPGLASAPLRLNVNGPVAQPKITI